MNKKINKSFLLLLLSLLQLYASGEVREFAIDLEDPFDKDLAVSDTKKVDFQDSLDGISLVKTLGFGQKLGNQLDAWQTHEKNEGLGSNAYWGNPETTEEMIGALVSKGFKAIRIPVTQHNHLVDTRDSEWMQRVKEIVDWYIERKMVILNKYHDNMNMLKINIYHMEMDIIQ